MKEHVFYSYPTPPGAPLPTEKDQAEATDWNEVITKWPDIGGAVLQGGICSGDRADCMICEATLYRESLGIRSINDYGAIHA